MTESFSLKTGGTFLVEMTVSLVVALRTSWLGSSGWLSVAFTVNFRQREKVVEIVNYFWAPWKNY